MLKPETLAALPAPLVKLWQAVSDDILKDVARRVGKMNGLTDTAEYQLWRYEQTRALRTETVSTLARYTGKSNAEIRRLLRQAGTQTLAEDDALYAAAGKHLPAVNDSPALVALLNAGYAQTAGEWRNLTATTASTVTGEFEAACDRAWLQISSGAFDYNTAIRRTVSGLAANMPEITYPTGHKDKLEVAVRRCALTGVNQTAGKLQAERASEAGWEFFEVTAHAGARPTHAVWQGKVYHKGGRVVADGVVYEDFVKSTGYGTGPGLCGWNCRHSFSPFWPGISERTWTDEQLAALDAKTIEHGGKMYSEYEISQMQRALERKVRDAKRQYLAQTAAGQDAGQEAAKLKQARQTLKAFTSATQQSTSDSVRTFVPGFGRSEASKAAAAAAKKSTLTSASASPIIEQNAAKNGAVDVYTIGKIDLSIYKCVSDDITTDEVVLTEERIKHIRERHPGAFEKVEPYLSEALNAPDYILEDKNPNTGLILKAVEENGLRFQMVLRVHTTHDTAGFKNSILSAWEIGDARWDNYVENKKILYKRK